MSMQLHSAASVGDLGLVNSLLENGADVNGTKGNTHFNYHPPLNLAAKNGYIEVVDLLIQKGAKLDSTDNCGYRNTPLHQACKKDHIEIAKRLLKSGANINAINDDGQTPLHIACKKGHIEIVVLLIKNKANLNIADKNKVLPLLLTEAQQKTEIVNLLKENGAEILAFDDNKIALLDSLARKNHIELAKLIIEAILLKNLSEKKPDFLPRYEELSDHWDTIDKINFLLQSKMIGCNNWTKKNLPTILEKNETLRSLSFHRFFQLLNPAIIKAKLCNETNKSESNTPSAFIS